MWFILFYLPLFKECKRNDGGKGEEAFGVTLTVFEQIQWKLGLNVAEAEVTQGIGAQLTSFSGSLQR